MSLADRTSLSDLEFPIVPNLCLDLPPNDSPLAMDLYSPPHEDSPALVKWLYDGDEEAVRALLKTDDNNWSLNLSNGRTVLHLCVAMGCESVCRMVLERLPTNQLGWDVNSKDVSGQTALMIACQSQHFHLIKMLVEVGAADLNALDEQGHSALFYSIVNQDVPSATFLIRQGANWRVKDKNQRTYLHLACDRSNEPIVKVLLQYPFPTNEKDNLGKTPLLYCVENNFYGVIPILLSRVEDTKDHSVDGKPLSDFTENQKIKDMIEKWAPRKTERAQSVPLFGPTPSTTNPSVDKRRVSWGKVEVETSSLSTNSGSETPSFRASSPAFNNVEIDQEMLTEMKDLKDRFLSLKAIYKSKLGEDVKDIKSDVLSKAQKQVAQLQQSILDLKLTSNDLKKQMNQIIEGNDHKVKVLVDERKDIFQKLENYADRQKSLVEEHDVMAKKLDELKTATKNVAALKDKLKTILALKDKLQDKLTTIDQESEKRQKIEHEYENLQKELKEKNHQLKKYEEELAAEKKKFSQSLESRDKKIEEIKAEMKQQIAARDHKIEEINSDTLQLKEKLAASDKLYSESKILHSNLDNVEQKYKSSLEKTRKAEDLVEQLTHENEKLQAKVQALKTELKDQESEKKEHEMSMKKQLLVEKSTVQLNSEEIQKLRDQLDVARKELAQLRHSSSSSQPISLGKTKKLNNSQSSLDSGLTRTKAGTEKYVDEDESSFESIMNECISSLKSQLEKERSLRISMETFLQTKDLTFTSKDQLSVDKEKWIQERLEHHSKESANLKEKLMKAEDQILSLTQQNQQQEYNALHLQQSLKQSATELEYLKKQYEMETQSKVDNWKRQYESLKVILEQKEKHFANEHLIHEKEIEHHRKQLEQISEKKEKEIHSWQQKVENSQHEMKEMFEKLSEKNQMFHQEILHWTTVNTQLTSENGQLEQEIAGKTSECERLKKQVDDDWIPQIKAEQFRADKMAEEKDIYKGLYMRIQTVYEQAKTWYRMHQASGCCPLESTDCPFEDASIEEAIRQADGTVPSIKLNQDSSWNDMVQRQLQWAKVQHQQQIENFNEELEEYRKANESQKLQIVSLEAEIRKSQEFIQICETTLDKRQAEYQGLKNEWQASHSEMLRLQHEQDNWISQKATFEAQLVQQKLLLEERMDRIEQLEETNENWLKKEKEHSDQVEQLHDEIEELKLVELKLTKLQDYAQGLENKEIDSINKVKELQEVKAQNEAEIEKLIKFVEEEKATNQSLESEIQDLEQLVNKKEMEMQQFLSSQLTMKEKLETIDRLTVQVKEKEGKIEDLKKENSSIRKSLDEKTFALDQVKTDKDQLQSQIQMQEEMFEKVEAEWEECLENYHQRCDDYETRLTQVEFREQSLMEQLLNIQKVCSQKIQQDIQNENIRPQSVPITFQDVPKRGRSRQRKSKRSPSTSSPPKQATTASPVRATSLPRVSWFNNTFVPLMKDFVVQTKERRDLFQSVCAELESVQRFYSSALQDIESQNTRSGTKWKKVYEMNEVEWKEKINATIEKMVLLENLLKKAEERDQVMQHENEQLRMQIQGLQQELMWKTAKENIAPPLMSQKTNHLQSRSFSDHYQVNNMPFYSQQMNSVYMEPVVSASPWKICLDKLDSLLRYEDSRSHYLKRKAYI